jgi:hypothetical protein
MIKKINQFILERFPTMWNTQFIWMMLFGVLTHIIFFVAGYAALNYDLLKTWGINYHFFRNSLFAVYAIICLLAIIFMGLRYFAHNPFKHFYPVSKLYFWKIFTQLFLIALLFSSVYVSFEQGMIVKGKRIVPEAKVDAEVKALVMAEPFLFNNVDDYKILNRAYPKPFPCQEISDFVIGVDSETGLNITHDIDRSKPYLSFPYIDYQFGKVETFKIDSCINKDSLVEIIDVTKSYGVAKYSVYNYRLNVARSFTLIDNEDPLYKKIHGWVLQKDSVALATCLQQLKSVCLKYDIGQELSPTKMARAILLQNLDEEQLVSTGYYDYRDPYRNATVSVATAATEATGVTNDVKQNIDYNYSVDMDKLTNIFDNTSTLNTSMGLNKLYGIEKWFLIFTALGFALFFIGIKYLPLKNVVLGVVIAGVLSILLGLLYSTSRVNEGKSLMLLAIVYSAIIITLGLFLIYGKKTSKAFANNWFVSFTGAMFAFLPLLYLYIREVTQKGKMDECSDYYNTYYTFEPEPWHFVVLMLIAASFIFIFLRKLHAKEE